MTYYFEIIDVNNTLRYFSRSSFIAEYLFSDIDENPILSVKNYDDCASARNRKNSKSRILLLSEKFQILRVPTYFLFSL